MSRYVNDDDDEAYDIAVAVVVVVAADVVSFRNQGALDDGVENRDQISHFLIS